jgi:hypothetical protein
MLKTICDAIRLVSTVEVFDPALGQTKEITAKITGVRTTKIWFKNNVSVWSLSFNIDEL